MNPTIQITTGGYFDLKAPDCSAFDIADIANALSNLCRFTGHTHTFYSVAQHSVLVSQIVSPDLAFVGLMHDAHEAFVGDMSAPLKELVPQFGFWERHIARAVRAKFGLPMVLPEEVKRADMVLLATERRDLMPPDHGYTEWLCLRGHDPLPERIEPLPPLSAHGLFLNRFLELRPKAIAA